MVIMMTQSDFFGNAQWVGAAERTRDSFAVLRGRFEIKEGEKVTLNVLGLGFFHAYINGTPINPDTFLPLSSDYEAGADPSGEILSGHRVYVPSFAITPHVHAGTNVIAVHYGGGWYTHADRPFGLPKVIWSVLAEGADGIRRMGSDTACRIGPSPIRDYDFIRHEDHGVPAGDPFAPDFDDSGWDFAVPTEALVSEYSTTDCPADKLIAVHTPVCLGKYDGLTLWDAGRNQTGYPVLRIPAGKKATVRFYEALDPNGRPDPAHWHHQSFTAAAGDTEILAQPEFTWFGYRYFTVEGEAEPVTVKEIHADVPLSSGFACEDETLNWIFDTFAHTMLCNMHTGHPSDCPHLERRGYTGDGQLTCHAVLTMFDAVPFYEKWLQDIADSQDTLTGHIQYTAPYIRSGGGPGGWGCAIVEVPYQLWQHTGRTDLLEKYWPNMNRYIDYLEAHSEFGLVISDRAGEWCLGDWCGPNILYPERDITFCDQQVMLPAPMVNTYFMIKSLTRMCEIARAIGREAEIPALKEKEALRRRAMQAAYFNTFDGNFVMNVQGANAFAADLGLGDGRTFARMKDYYKKLGFYDTGIFATDILTRVLFERGEGKLALQLLTGEGEQGFAHWKKNGATTFHEYWDSNRSRSHNHPMFGAPAACLFDRILGIGQAAGTVGYTSLVIEPLADSLAWASGWRTLPGGRVSVGWEHTDGGIRFTVALPEGIEAVLRFGGQEIPLRAGENCVMIPER